MAWILRWSKNGHDTVRSGRRRVSLNVTVGNSDSEIHQLELTAKDIWNLRNGSMVLRSGLLVVPDGDKLRFLIARPGVDNAKREIAILDVDVLRTAN